MVRTARVVLVNYPHHVIQRGHNRQGIFVANDDYLFCLDNLREWKETLGVKTETDTGAVNRTKLPLREQTSKQLKGVAGEETMTIE